jgi:hypothetical protein
MKYSHFMTALCVVLCMASALSLQAQDSKKSTINSDNQPSFGRLPKLTKPSRTSKPASTPAPIPRTAISSPEQLVPGWANSFTPSLEVYVSVNGNDNNDGSSLASALRTTSAAVRKLAPGVRLNFAAGTYDCAGGYIFGIYGGTASPASIRSLDGPRAAKFDCSSTGAGFLLDNVHGFIFEGIELYNATNSHGIQVMTSNWTPANLSSDILLHNSFIHNTGYASMKSSQSKNITVIGNEFAYANPDRQNVEFVAVDNVIIAGNEAHHSGLFDEIKGGARGGIIYRNYIHDSLGGIIVGGPGTGNQFMVHPEADYEAEDVIVWENVIVNANDGAFRFWGCHSCAVVNNTFWSPTPNSAIRILPDWFGDGTQVYNRNLTIANNIFMSGSTFNDMIPGWMSETEGLVMTNNVWWAAGRSTTIGIYSDIPFADDPGSFYSTDPLLISPPGNIRLSPTSPMIGQCRAASFVKRNVDTLIGCFVSNIGAY